MIRDAPTRAETATELVEERSFRYRIEPHGGMRVPGVGPFPEVLADADHSPAQVRVGALPGIVVASPAVPDTPRSTASPSAESRPPT